jgi:hypothetical protein
LNLVSSSLSGLQGELGPIGVGFDLVGGALGTVSSAVKSIPIVGDVLGPFTDAVAVIPGILKDITGTLTNFAAKANPATFTLFQHAVEDVQGVIGQRFLPVLELMTEGVRLVGDVLQTILPTGEQVRVAIGNIRSLFGDLGDKFGDIASTLGPAIRHVLIGGLYMLAGAVYFVTAPLIVLTNTLHDLGTVVERFTGLNLMPGTESSMGAAARPAHFSDSDQYREQLQLGAYSQGTGTSQAQVPSLVQNIHDMLSRWTQAWTLDAVTERVRQAMVNAVTPPALPSVVSDNMADTIVGWLGLGNNN